MNSYPKLLEIGIYACLKHDLENKNAFRKSESLYFITVCEESCSFCLYSLIDVIPAEWWYPQLLVSSEAYIYAADAHSSV